MLFWERQKTTEKQDLKKLQHKGTHQNTTPQDGDTYPYNTESDTNVQTYVSTIEHEYNKPTMERRTTQRTTRRMQNNNKMWGNITGAVKSDLMRTHVRQKNAVLAKINSNGEKQCRAHKACRSCGKSKESSEYSDARLRHTQNVTSALRQLRTTKT